MFKTQSSNNFGCKLSTKRMKNNVWQEFIIYNISNTTFINNRGHLVSPPWFLARTVLLVLYIFFLVFFVFVLFVVLRCLVIPKLPVFLDVLLRRFSLTLTNIMFIWKSTKSVSCKIQEKIYIYIVLKNLLCYWIIQYHLSMSKSKWQLQIHIQRSWGDSTPLKKIGTVSNMLTWNYWHSTWIYKMAATMNRRNQSLHCINLYTRYPSSLFSLTFTEPTWFYDSLNCNYLCNRGISPLKLWVRIPPMTRCTRYIIMW